MIEAWVMVYLEAFPSFLSSTLNSGLPYNQWHLRFDEIQ